MEHIAPGSYYPADKNPLLIGSPDQLLERLSPVPEQANHFTLGGDIRPAPESPTTLEPFYQIHDSRYTLYWRTADESEYAQLAAQLEAKPPSKS